MRRLYLSIFALFCACVCTSAQTSERYEQRYDLLVSQFGPAGVGVETVLDKWAEVDSTNAKMLFGRFTYFFTKAQTTAVVTKPQKKYLGMEPLLTLKDTLGNDVYYYQVNDFDDQLYGKAIQTVDKLISIYPDRIDYRFAKANAYIAYEKESPDMALSYLLAMADSNLERGSRPWIYEEEKVDEAFFADAMLEYCYSFYTIGTPSSLKAFMTLSQKMSKMYPDNLGYQNNIAAYYMVAEKDYKTALKLYSKVLKKQPDDMTALQNCVLAARKLDNVKLEQKYLKRLAELRMDQMKSE